MRTKKQTGFVVVSKDWMDSGVRYFVNDGRTSRSTSDTHIVIAEVEDTSDARGLWLRNVKTTQFTREGSDVTTMKFMIPWTFVLGLGLADAVAGNTDLGFCPEGARIWDEPPEGGR